MSDSADLLPETPQAPPRGPVWLRWYVWLALFLFLLAAAAALAWWYFQKPQKLDVWQQASVPYSDGCEGGCTPWRKIAPAHGGAPADSSANPPQLVYNPRIDDAVAQWGDCLQSINSCMIKLPRNDDKGFRGCVTNSVCPKPCKDRFAARAGSSMDSAEAAYYHVFTNKDAVCRPEEPS